MCLNGSLDDLSIQDVLQVLSQGKKTGCLCLETPAGGGAIVFRDGRVVASFDGGDLLRASGVVPHFAAERERLVRERTVAFVHRLARCPRGQFRFELATESPWAAAAGQGLSSGLDVIELLIDVASRSDDGEGKDTHSEPRATPPVARSVNQGAGPEPPAPKAPRVQPFVRRGIPRTEVPLA